MLLTHPAEKSSQHKTVTCDGVKESIASVRMPQDEQERHRMDIDMSIKSIGWVFALTVAGLLAIFYAFVSPESLPSMQNVRCLPRDLSLASH